MKDLLEYYRDRTRDFSMIWDRIDDNTIRCELHDDRHVELKRDQEGSYQWTFIEDGEIDSQQYGDSALSKEIFELATEGPDV